MSLGHAVECQREWNRASRLRHDRRLLIDFWQVPTSDPALAQAKPPPAAKRFFSF
jgi:hypothetical protein